MPTLTLNLRYLFSLVGRELSDSELSELLEKSKMSLERIEGDEIEVEVTTDRLDLLSEEGIARHFKGLLGIEEGIPKYEVFQSDVEGIVEESVMSVRPGFALGIVLGVHLGEEGLLSLMHLQEKIHQTWGRERRKVSIGVHDFDKLEPPITYAGERPEDIRFVPLGESEIMNAREIINRHEKGIAYGHIIADKPLFPVLRDRRGEVLSLPPIINSEMTRVTSETRNLLIDVTGTSQREVEQALIVVATALAEKGGKIGTVKLKGAKGEFVTPDLTPKVMSLEAEYFRAKTGLNLSPQEIANLLRKSRLDAVAKQEVVEALIPPYRVDFLHPIDLVEEALIAYGYNKLGWEIPNVMTIGRVHPKEKFSKKVRLLMVGLGYQEILSYVMTSEKELFDKVLRPKKPIVKVANPVSKAFAVLRDSLMPGLLSFLSNNVHASYPQLVFEVGDVVVVDESQETKTRNERRVAAALADDVVSFERIQAHLDALLRNLGVKYGLERFEHPTLIKGRSAKVLYELKSGTIEAGYIGEVRPEVLEVLGLRCPVGVFEVNLDPLIGG